MPTKSNVFTEYSSIAVSRQDPIVKVVLNRPESLNAFDNDMLDDLNLFWDELKEDGDARVVLITGAGPAFSVGGDIDLLESFHEDVDASILSSRKFSSAMHKMLDCELPIISAINGDTLGGGFSLSLHSDISLISDKARILIGAQMNISVLSGPEVHLLPLMCSPMKARYLLLRSGFISAQEADDLGLVSRVVDHSKLMDEATGLAKDIAARDPMTVAWTKRTCNQTLNTTRPMLDYYTALEGFMFGRKEAKIGLKRMRQALDEE